MSALSELLNEANVEGWSMQRITDRARELGHDIGRDTVWKFMTGRHGKVQEPYLRAFADVFPKAKLDQLRRAAKAPTDYGEWTPPQESRALNVHERDALALIIRSMARRKTTGLEAHQDEDDSMTDPRLVLPDETPAVVPAESDRTGDRGRSGEPASDQRRRRSGAGAAPGSRAPRRPREARGGP